MRRDKNQRYIWIRKGKSFGKEKGICKRLIWNEKKREKVRKEISLIVKAIFYKKNFFNILFKLKKKKMIIAFCGANFSSYPFQTNSFNEKMNVSFLILIINSSPKMCSISFFNVGTFRTFLLFPVQMITITKESSYTVIWNGIYSMKMPLKLIVFLDQSSPYIVSNNS